MSRWWWPFRKADQSLETTDLKAQPGADDTGRSITLYASVPEYSQMPVMRCSTCGTEAPSPPYQDGWDCPVQCGGIVYATVEKPNIEPLSPRGLPDTVSPENRLVEKSPGPLPTTADVITPDLRARLTAPPSVVEPTREEKIKKLQDEIQQRRADFIEGVNYMRGRIRLNIKQLEIQSPRDVEIDKPTPAEIYEAARKAIPVPMVTRTLTDSEGVKWRRKNGLTEARQPGAGWVTSGNYSIPLTDERVDIIADLKKNPTEPLPEPEGWGQP